MSESLSYPISESVARALVEDALVPRVAASSAELGLGHIESREALINDELKGCVVVLGAFDGFHLGHAALMRDALDNASKIDKPTVAATFWPDPSEVLGFPQGRLMDARQRTDSLLGAGGHAVLVFRFDDDFASLSAEQFVDTLLEILDPSEVHVGTNFSFGYKGSGTTETLSELCSARGVAVHVKELLQLDGQAVSATRIRSLVGEAKLEEAKALMGRYLSLTGTVEHGRGEGTGFGFSTANIEVEAERVQLPGGVYAGYTVVDGVAWPTAANAGSPESFGGGDENLIEAHLLGFDGDIYGKTASFVPLCLLREERHFDSQEELVETVRGNIEWVEQNLGKSGLEVSE